MERLNASCKCQKLFQHSILNLIIHFETNNDDVPPGKEAIELMKKLKAELTQLEEAQGKILYFYYASWLESKISGRAFSEILQEKVKKAIQQRRNN